MSAIKKLEQAFAKQELINIADFMQLVITEYYLQAKIGSQGDFTTAPEISQMFGELIGIWAAHNFQELKQDKINLVELGPGNGTLMKDLLRATKHIDKFHEGLNIKLIEQSISLQKKQQQNLEGYEIKWLNKLSEIKNNLPSIYIANEFFDCLPVRQFKKLGTQFFEVLINRELQFIEQQVDNQQLISLLQHDYSDVKNDEIIEISFTAQEIFQNIVSNIKINKGAALIIDYGYNIKNAEKRISTLQAIHNHQFCGVFEHLGQADLTAHVDFSSFEKIVKASGLQYLYLTQNEFLHSLGIEYRLKQLINNAENEEIVSNLLSQYKRLTDKEQMGELFKVLIIYNY